MPVPPSGNPRFKRSTILLTAEEFDVLKNVPNVSEFIRLALAGRLNRLDSSVTDPVKKVFAASIDFDEDVQRKKNEARRKADEKMAKSLRESS